MNDLTHGAIYRLLIGMRSQDEVVCKVGAATVN
jgi:hypothetical protein